MCNTVLSPEQFSCSGRWTRRSAVDRLDDSQEAGSSILPASTMQTHKLTPEQKEWANRKIGIQINIEQEQAAPSRRKGTVIDWKSDTVGVGVFFILELDTPDPDGEVYTETYRSFPVNLGSDRAKESKSLRMAMIKRGKKAHPSLYPT